MVVNSLPSPLHVDATIEAFKKGYHVLSEKPLAKKVPTPHTPLHPTLPFFFLALPAAREEPPSAPPALPPYLAATTSAPSSSLANLTAPIASRLPTHLPNHCRLPTSIASSPPSRNPARHSSPSSRIDSSRSSTSCKRSSPAVRETHPFEQSLSLSLYIYIYVYTISLPRQARDRHSKSTHKEMMRLPQASWERLFISNRPGRPSSAGGTGRPARTSGAAACSTPVRAYYALRAWAGGSVASLFLLLLLLLSLLLHLRLLHLRLLLLRRLLLSFARSFRTPHHITSNGEAERKAPSRSPLTPHMIICHVSSRC